jgi:uncharacterized membrane protein required for colicin V production
MSIFLDVMTVFVFIVIIYRSYKRGIIKTIINFVGCIASFVMAYFLSLPLGNWLNTTFVYKYVSGKIMEAAKSNDLINSQFFKDFVGSVPKTIEKALYATNSTLGALGEKVLKSVVEAVAVPLSQLISREIAFFIILFVCLIIISIIVRASDVIRRVPVIGTLNALAGAAVGVAEAFILMFIICAFVSIMLSFMSLQKNPLFTSSVIDSTHIYQYINNINPLKFI